MLRGDDYPPVRANPSDAGLDLRWTPGEVSETAITVLPGESVLVPTGCKFAIPHGYMMEIKNKSGIATKLRLLVGACVVDAGYTGEIYVNLQNIGKTNQRIAPGQKIAQAVVIPIVTPDIWETPHDPAIRRTARGSGGFGSTGEF